MAAAHPLPFNTPRDWALDLAAAAVAGAFLGLLGPFGSYYNDAAPARVIYWIGSFMANAALYGLMLRWTLPRARAAGVPIWVWLPALVVVGSVPMAVALCAGAWLWLRIDPTQQLFDEESQPAASSEFAAIAAARSSG